MSYYLFCLNFRCRGRVIVDCVLNFVAMATGVSCSRIYVTSFNSTTPKTPCWKQRSPRYLVYRARGICLIQGELYSRYWL